MNIKHLQQDEDRIYKAIAITSYTREVAANRVLEAGFDRFLPKHFDSEELISTILDLG